MVRAARSACVRFGHRPHDCCENSPNILCPVKQRTRRFVNRHGAKLTRFGVRYLLKKYIKASSTTASTLKEKRIHPHSLRHTTAIYLLKAGVDFATISQWLGHSTLNTTMTYARADLDLKRQALLQVFPEILEPPRGGRVAPAAVNVIDWLKRL